MDPDGLVGVGRESTRVSLQARRVVVDLNPSPKRAASEIDVARAMGSVQTGRADESRRVAAAVISGRAQAGRAAGDWGLWSPAGPPPKAFHQRAPQRYHHALPDLRRTT